jgi:hypothetical protein
VAKSFSKENILVPLIVVMSTVLFFVRVNQVLVRLWARAMEAGLCPVFVPSLRLMSDRESVSGVSTPLFGVLNHRPCAPKSDDECSEAFV